MATLLLTAIGACAASLLAMALALRLTHVVAMIGSFVTLTLSKNPGIAFSLSLPSPWQELLIGAALIGVIIVAIRSTLTRPMAIAFGLIIGGALANLIDRSLHGAVTDFIAIGTFPVFNLADSAISIGAGMLLLESLGGRQRK